MTTDFAWVWFGARAWLDGLNPYDAVGPGRLYEFWCGLWYPFPTVLVGVPFTLLSLHVANALFVSLSAAALAWAINRRPEDAPKLLVFASFAWLSVVETAQWSALITAAALTPTIGFLLACKPTIGAALFLAYPSRQAFIGAAVFGLVTVALWPWWVSSWLRTIATEYTHFVPIARWGGPLVLLALLRWRRPESRLLVALACIPQTPNLYEAVPLFLLVSTWFEGAALVVLTAVVAFGAQIRFPGTGPGLAEYLLSLQQWMVWAIYLPCTLLVLLRPNEGDIPAVVDRGIARFQRVNPLRRWL